MPTPTSAASQASRPDQESSPGGGQTKAWLLAALKSAKTLRDPEEAHLFADNLLLAYIDDPEITAAFEAIERWYA